MAWICFVVRPLYKWDMAGPHERFPERVAGLSEG